MTLPTLEACRHAVQFTSHAGEGIESTFYLVGEYGLKTFYERDVAFRRLWAQRALYALGLAPKPFGTVFKAGHSWCYITEVIDYTFFADWVKIHGIELTEKGWVSGAEEDWLDRENDDHHDLKWLRHRMGCAGFISNDMHSENWGYLRGKPVVIDMDFDTYN